MRSIEAYGAMLRNEDRPGPAPMTNGAQTHDSRPVVAFDLDGTLLTGDSLVPFLLRYGWSRRRFGALARMPLILAGYLLRALSAHTTKERLLLAFFRDESEEVIRLHAERFCETWVRSHLRDIAIERLERHRRSGDRLILLSASPDLYVPIVARFLGIEETICTDVRRQGDRCVGTIIGANCKGTAKVERLAEHLGVASAPPGSTAYGDQSSDLPVLTWVTDGYLLRRGEFQRVAKNQAVDAEFQPSGEP